MKQVILLAMLASTLGPGQSTTSAQTLPQDIIESAGAGDYRQGYLVSDWSDNAIYQVLPSGETDIFCSEGFSHPIGAAFLPDEFTGRGERLFIVNENEELDNPVGPGVVVVEPDCTISTFIEGLDLHYPVGVSYIPLGIDGHAEGKLVITGFDTPYDGKVIFIDGQRNITRMIDGPASWTPVLAPADFGNFPHRIFIGQVSGPIIYALNQQSLQWTRFAAVPLDEHMHGLRQIAFSPPGWAALIDPTLDPTLEDESALLVSVASIMRPTDPPGPGAIMVWDQRGRLVAELREAPNGQDIDPRGLLFVGNDLYISDVTAGRAGILLAGATDFALPDCNADAIADGLQISGCPLQELWCRDCNDNGVLDACEVDCNGNGVLDECETISGGDFNGDGSVDQYDLVPFTECLSGPDGRAFWYWVRCAPSCLAAFDFDNDEDVDLADFGEFQMAYGGNSSSR